MKTLLRAALPLLTVASLAWTAEAQKTGQGGPEPPKPGGTVDPRPGPGGSYTGPGDTTPTGTGLSPNRSPNSRVAASGTVLRSSWRRISSRRCPMS